MLEGDRNKAAAITLFGWLTTLKALISTVRFQKGNQYVEWFSDTDGSKGVRTNLTPLFRDAKLSEFAKRSESRCSLSRPLAATMRAASYFSHADRIAEQQ